MDSTLTRRRTSIAALLAAVLAAMIGIGATAFPDPAAAQNPYQRGPNPTESSIEALRGSYSTSSTSVSSLVIGFGGGTIYYPTTTSDGTFGGVAIAPGFTAYESSIAWLGPRLASQGFVVFTIDTDTTLDQPGQRADQIQAALDYLTGAAACGAAWTPTASRSWATRWAAAVPWRPPATTRTSRPASR